MIDLVRLQRTNDTNVVRDFTRVRENCGQHLAGFSVTFERMLWPQALQLVPLPLQLRNLLAFGVRPGHGLAVHFRQLLFVVVGLQMRWPARHTEKNHPLRLRRVVRLNGSL